MEKNKTATLTAQANQKRCRLGNVTLGCVSAFLSFTSSNTDLRTLLQEKTGDTTPFNIMSQKMMKVLGGSCTSTFSLCGSEREFVLLLMIHEPAVQHAVGELQAPRWMDHRHTWAHSSRLAGKLVSPKEQIYLITGTKHPWSLHA